MSDNDYSKVKVLIVGAGPAGLSAAISLKAAQPLAEVCVVEKGAEPGNHNLSGAAFELKALAELLDSIDKNWRTSDDVKELLANRVEKDHILFMLGGKLALDISFAVKIAKLLKLGFGQMIHKGDYSVSISRMTKYLASAAQKSGVEVLSGFAAEDIIYDENSQKAVGIKLVDQGLDKDGNRQPNYIAGEIITADLIILAEGCDGLVTEKFIAKAGLQRQADQLYSVGVKELIKVSDEQYRRFGKNRMISAMGYPLWTPILGPAMFGGAIMYPMSDNHIAVGIIVAADWKYHDFNPQDALTNFKNHRFVKKFIAGGTVVEAGAKMVPEGGYYAIPRNPQTSAIGKNNVLILGDSAGLVNMLKIKGLHNAVYSGIAAGKAAAQSIDNPVSAAVIYTELLDGFGVIRKMRTAKNFRQTIARFGLLIGMALSILGRLLPKFKIEPDYKAMTSAKYKLKPLQDYDKDTFGALSATCHREDQPSHLTIIDRDICSEKCTPKFASPCITFCPAGVYETIQNTVKPANPSNCLHCKTCQRKCPFDNIRWTVPEGSGGPRYKQM